MILLLTLVALPATAQTVHVDYDRSVDFDSFRSFAWAATPETSIRGESPLTHSRIKNAIEHYLAEAGLVEDTAQPDVYVTYHTSSKEEVTYHTSSFGADYGGGWGWDPYWGGRGMTTSTTRANTYERGTLIIDLWDAESKQMIWRGSASTVVSQKPEKEEKQIYKAIKKMIAAFDKKYQKGK
jgi:hypothetical protein